MDTNNLFNAQARQRLNQNTERSTVPPNYADVMEPKAHSTMIHEHTANATQAREYLVKDPKWFEKQLLRNRYAYLNTILILGFVFSLVATALTVQVYTVKLELQELKQLTKSIDRRLSKSSALGEPAAFLNTIKRLNRANINANADKINFSKEEIIASVRNSSHWTNSKIADIGENCNRENTELRNFFTEMKNEFNKFRNQIKHAMTAVGTLFGG